VRVAQSSARLVDEAGNTAAPVCGLVLCAPVSRLFSFTLAGLILSMRNLPEDFTSRAWINPAIRTCAWCGRTFVAERGDDRPGSSYYHVYGCFREAQKLRQALASAVPN
jgi:hypothetical protein